MAISDLFSTSFLFSIAIIVILIGGIFAYVSYKMSEQDHKLNSMIGLISSMAEESQFFRSKINMLQQQISTKDSPVDKIQYTSQMMGGQQEELIEVSDDDEDEVSDDEDEVSDDDEDEVSDDDEDEVSDDEEEDVSDEDDEETNIRILNLSLINETPDHNLDIENISITHFEPYDGQEEIKTIHLEEPIDFEEDVCFLKNVSAIDLDENDDNNTSKTDYKKMQLTKLREIVVSKGIVNDASKFKKNEILKLLGDE
jgi:hypothetical protein